MSVELLKRTLKVLPTEYMDLRKDIEEYLDSPNDDSSAVGRVGRTGVVTWFSKVKEGDYLYLHPLKEKKNES